MKSIYKYKLKETNKQEIVIPSSKILSVHSQREAIVVYALVDTDNSKDTKYEFRVYGTGHDVQEDIDDYNFLGTVKLADGYLMFHVFYKEVEDKETENAEN